MADDEPYILDEQVGFLLRRANQRHRLIFTQNIGADLAPTQFAALAKLYERGPTSQNVLGRMTAMDSATIAGVVDRLSKRGLVQTYPTPEDSRMRIVELTDIGLELVVELVPAAREATRQTVEALNARERDTLYRLLEKIS